MKVELANVTDTPTTWTLSAGLDRGLDLTAEFAYELDRLGQGDVVTLRQDEVVAQCIVDNFRSEAGSTWFRAIDPATQPSRPRSANSSPGFLLESFSGAEGSSRGRAIEARLPVGDAPPKLYSISPAVQVDGSLMMLLHDAAASLGCHWWFGSRGLQFGTVAPTAVAVMGEARPRVPHGRWIEVSLNGACLPWPGMRLECGDHEGAVLEVGYSSHQGVLRCSALLGEPRLPSRYTARATALLEAQVMDLQPFQVSYTTPAGLKLRTQARCMGPAGLGKLFQIRYPVQVGDRGYLLLAAEGVLDTAPLYVPWREYAPDGMLAVLADAVRNEHREQTNMIPLVTYPNTERFEIA